MTLSAVAFILTLFVLKFNVTQAAPSLKFTTPVETLFRINQNFVSGEVITQVTCISSEMDFIIRYRLIDDSGDKFNINETTGVISMAIDAQLLPCPGDKICTFTPAIACTASSDGRYLTSNQADVLINATEITILFHTFNEFIPVLSHSIPKISIPEDTNFTARPILTILNATDKDLGLCGEIRYAIVDGNLHKNFEIDPVSGVVMLVSRVDYETKHVYSLLIQISNPRCSPHEPLKIHVIINIIDVNDEQPVFEPHTYFARVQENTQPNYLVRFNCSDLDTTSDFLKFDEMFVGWPFAVDINSGVVSATGPLDYEEQSSYELQFKCYDLTRPSSFDIATVKIDILPVDEFPPTLLYGSTSHLVLSDMTPVGTLIASNIPDSDAQVYIGATDLDQGSNHASLHFALSPHINPEVVDYFSLDSDTGNVTLVKPLQYLTCSINNEQSLYPVRLGIAVCGVNQRREDCPTHEITLILHVTGDCSPSIDENLHPLQVNESTPPGSELYKIICKTPGRSSDGAGSHFKKLSVITDDLNVKGLFEIVNDTLVLQGSLDYEKETNFSLVIECLDTVSNQEAYTLLNIQVLPSNDNRPVFTRPYYVFTLDSENSFQLPYTIGQVQALDNDHGYGGELTYRVNGTGDAQFFQVDSLGMVTLVQPPNSTACNKLITFIEATDGMFTDQSLVVVKTASSRRAQMIVLRTESGCDSFCIAFVLTLVCLVLSFAIHFVSLVACVCCYRRKQRENVAKFQESILETNKVDSLLQLPNNLTLNNQLDEPSPYSKVVTVPCPMYSTQGDSPANPDSYPYHYITTPKRCTHQETKLPPIPGQQPMHCKRKSSTKSDFEEYLEMHSVQKRQRFKSDSGVCQTSPDGDPILSGKEAPLMDDEERTVKRKSVDNIYDFIA